VAKLERNRRLPNRHERFHIREALDKLAAAQYAAAEDAVLRAESSLSIPKAHAEELAVSDRFTVSDIRAALESILKAAG